MPYQCCAMRLYLGGPCTPMLPCLVAVIALVAHHQSGCSVDGVDAPRRHLRAKVEVLTDRLMRTSVHKSVSL